MSQNLEPRTYNLSVYCDGGSRGNPGPAACAFVIYNDAGNLLEKRGKYLGISTNNVAEYSAIIEALTYISSLQYPVSSIQFFLDSSLVVNQINGLFKVKEPRLQNLLIKIRELENQISIRFPLSAISYSYVPRSQNSAADLLVNQTLDLATKKPTLSSEL